jgi:hypothetical protein
MLENIRSRKVSYKISFKAVVLDGWWFLGELFNQCSTVRNPFRRTHEGQTNEVKGFSSVKAPAINLALSLPSARMFQLSSSLHGRVTSLGLIPQCLLSLRLDPYSYRGCR